MLLSIEQILVGKRLRQPHPGRVADLAESIGKLGLMVPISVVSRAVKRSNGGGSDVAFDLVAGLHRLEACKSIGFTEIEVSVVQLDEAERQLWEIDENLCHIELSLLERGEHLMRRKEIYEKKWPQSKQHTAGAIATNAARGKVTKIGRAGDGFWTRRGSRMRDGVSLPDQAAHKPKDSSFGGEPRQRVRALAR